MSSLKYAEIDASCTRWIVSWKRYSQIRNERESFILFIFPKRIRFFLMRKEDFVEIQSAASSSRKVSDSRLRKGGEGEPDFTEAWKPNKGEASVKTDVYQSHVSTRRFSIERGTEEDSSGSRGCLGNFSNRRNPWEPLQREDWNSTNRRLFALAFHLSLPLLFLELLASFRRNEGVARDKNRERRDRKREEREKKERKMDGSSKAGCSWGNEDIRRDNFRPPFLPAFPLQ